MYLRCWAHRCAHTKEDCVNLLFPLPSCRCDAHAKRTCVEIVTKTCVVWPSSREIRTHTVYLLTAYARTHFQHASVRSSERAHGHDRVFIFSSRVDLRFTVYPSTSYYVIKLTVQSKDNISSQTSITWSLQKVHRYVRSKPTDFVMIRYKNSILKFPN